jgi:hypothetical protein
MTTMDEVELMDVLNPSVPLTFEDVIRLSGLSASQVLLSVDRLSRSGHVILRKVGADYHITRNATP